MKRIITILMAAALICAAVWQCRGAELRSVAAVPILMYHYIGDYDEAEGAEPSYYVSSELFRSHMAALKSRGYSAVTLEEVLGHWNSGAPLPDKPIVISFDDGYRCMYTEALPVLREFGFRATFFIYSDIIDSEIGLTRDMLAEMAAGGMEIASHSATHPDLTQLTEAEILGELSESRAFIASLTGRDVFTLSYPYGKNNAAVRACAESAGYKAAVTTEYGFAYDWSEPFSLSRIYVLAGDKAETILFKICVLGL